MVEIASGMVGKEWLFPLQRVKEARVNLINMLVVAALIGTVVVLVLGLRSMVRGGEYDREHAEKFMWERVALQALVIVILIAATFMLNT